MFAALGFASDNVALGFFFPEFSPLSRDFGAAKKHHQHCREKCWPVCGMNGAAGRGMGHVLPQPCSAASSRSPCSLSQHCKGLGIYPEHNTLCQLTTASSLLRAPAAKIRACATSATVPGAGTGPEQLWGAEPGAQGCRDSRDFSKHLTRSSSAQN